MNGIYLRVEINRPTEQTEVRIVFLMGGSSSGRRVNERSAMQMTAVYSCIGILLKV